MVFQIMFCHMIVQSVGKNHRSIQILDYDHIELLYIQCFLWYITLCDCTNRPQVMWLFSAPMSGSVAETHAGSPFLLEILNGLDAWNT